MIRSLTYLRKFKKCNTPWRFIITCTSNLIDMHINCINVYKWFEYKYLQLSRCLRCIRIYYWICYSLEVKVHRDSVTKIVKILNINNSNEFGLCSKTPKLKESTTISNKALSGRHYECLLMMEKQWTQTDLDTDENTSHDGYWEVFFLRKLFGGYTKLI